ncbi:MAG: type 1 glutamine amidotransferase [Nitratireductor sp.]|nr:type 1 glutamine amidotransferase [Nitratireductor sp.]
MRIAILLTDVDDSDFTRSFPNDAEKFRRLLQPLRPHWEYAIYSVKDNIFPSNLDDHDGYIITGSPASVHDDRVWIPRLFSLIRQADAARVPVIGACFGHQAIATALGGRVARNDKGWGLGATTTTFDRHLPWMTEKHREIRLYCAHNEQVVELPRGATVLGHDPVAPVSAFAIGGHILATQHHPEMTPDYVDGLLDYMEDDIDPEVMARARQSVAAGAEGTRFAGWMVEFLAAADAARRQPETGIEHLPEPANQSEIHEQVKAA